MKTIRPNISVTQLPRHEPRPPTCLSWPLRPADRLVGPPPPVVACPAGWTPALDGPWPALGQVAFDAFVWATAEALNADVARKGGR